MYRLQVLKTDINWFGLCIDWLLKTDLNLFGLCIDWVLKTDHGLDGDSLSYLDMQERNNQEENRRARERVIMDEGR